MNRLDPEASRRLDRYLDQMRAALSGSPSVDPGDVEADVTAHIQSELAGLPAPVTVSALDAVLERLGSPVGWVPDEDLSPWRRALGHLRAGPEDWRLAYLCLGSLLAGLLLAPLGFGPAAGVLFLASYLLARAVQTLFDERGESPGAQRWFVDPILVITHGGLLLALLGLPLILAVGGSEEIAQAEAHHASVPAVMIKHAELLQGVAAANEPIDTLVAVKKSAHVLFGILGTWFFLLGFAGRTWPAAPARIFRPLLHGFQRAHANLVLVAGAVVWLLALVFYGINS